MEETKPKASMARLVLLANAQGGYPNSGPEGTGSRVGT